MAIGHVAEGLTMPYTNAGGTTITAGTVIEFAAMIGIATADIAAGATGTLAIRQVWRIAKDATVAVTQGDQLYWDATSDSVDKTNTNITCGLAYTHEIADTPTIQVILNK